MRAGVPVRCARARRARTLHRLRPRQPHGRVTRSQPFRWRCHRADQPRGRQGGQPTQRRRHGDDAARVQTGLPAVGRRRLGRRAVRSDLWRWWTAMGGRHRGERDGDRCEHGVLVVPDADAGSDPHARRARQRRAEGPLSPFSHLRQVDRHDAVDRTTGRLRCGRAHHPGGEAARWYVPTFRPKDLHHVGRARPHRKHRAYHAGPHARCARRHPRHLGVHRAQVLGQRRWLDRGAQ